MPEETHQLSIEAMCYKVCEFSREILMHVLPRIQTANLLPHTSPLNYHTHCYLWLPRVGCYSFGLTFMNLVLIVLVPK
jgi:hypothetical protein